MRIETMCLKTRAGVTLQVCTASDLVSFLQEPVSSVSAWGQSPDSALSVCFVLWWAQTFCGTFLMAACSLGLAENIRLLIHQTSLMLLFWQASTSAPASPRSSSASTGCTCPRDQVLVLLWTLAPHAAFWGRCQGATVSLYLIVCLVFHAQPCTVHCSLDVCCF